MIFFYPWVEKNQKAILIFVGVVAVSVLGFLGFQNFIQEPKETEAMNEMFQAQSYYEHAHNRIELETFRSLPQFL